MTVMTRKLSQSQIGRCGELLLQQRLLMRGIESAPLTTDAGIDLVAYSPWRRHPVTLQVKSQLAPSLIGPRSGIRRRQIEWTLACESPAQVLAFVFLETGSIWFFKRCEFARTAHVASNGRHYWRFYLDDDVPVHQNTRRPVFVSELDKYSFEARLGKIFGVPSSKFKTVRPTLAA